MSSSPKVRVSGGLLEGVTATSIGGKEYYSFKGVPYAEPPVGNLRFKAPVSKKPWSDVYDATKEKDYCVQYSIFTNAAFGSEDCLYMNIHTPKLPDDKDEVAPLPVMFFIHGGGFSYGSGSADWFGPDFFVESDVVLVMINYRLASIGFMCLDSPDVPGNAGLKDQNLALKWVQENIRSFNGDPNNVTIFGISAGAASVEYQMLSPLSRGLFHKAILQSGSTLNPWARTRDPKKLVQKLKKALNIETNDPDEVLKSLQDVDPDKLVIAAYNLRGEEEARNGEMFTFTPVVEKRFNNVEAFLNTEPLELLEDGVINKVPTITGFCENEGSLMRKDYSETAIKDMENGKFIDYLPSAFNVDRIYFDDGLRTTYNENDKEVNVDNFLSDLYFVSGIYESLKHRSRVTISDYFYMFTHDGNINFVKSLFKFQKKGAMHGDDTSYLALNMFVKEDDATPEDKLVRSRMIKMWTDFAKTGNPTPEQCNLITTEWLQATSHNMVLLEIGKELQMKKFPLGERMDVWENIYESSVNLPRS